MTHPVHPVAALFPMMPDEDLAELAADIKERGLLQPVMLDKDGQILDGRNREAACRLAGVEPEFETYDGDDANGYALAVNITRRHLRPGARYIILEEARRLAIQANPYGDHGNISKNIYSLAAGSYQMALSQAAVVLDYAPDKRDEVLNGVLGLQAAAEIARKRKKDSEEIAARQRELQAEAPDIWSLVEDGRQSLDEAEAALAFRREQARQAQEKERLAAAAAESEAQRELELIRREHEAAIRRYTEALEAFLSGWDTAVRLRTDQFRDEVLAALAPYDRDAFLKAEERFT
jgi:ParB-like chromosome segregation protein Spo0J